jgi:hypothetical protein
VVKWSSGLVEESDNSESRNQRPESRVENFGEKNHGLTQINTESQGEDASQSAEWRAEDEQPGPEESDERPRIWNQEPGTRND